ncbi:MAG: aldehyde dehydrogenase family protein, partial [Thermodesulfobacteriota bacterium]
MEGSKAVLPVPTKQYGRLKNYINGEWVDSVSKQTRDVLNPATNELIAQVPLSTPGEVDEAIRAAKEAFPAWRETPAVTRARYFFTLKNLMEEHVEDLSRTLVQEMGKTIGEARGELRRALEEIEVACGIPALMHGYNAQDITPGIELKAVLEPLGIFFMVPAFNFPAMVPLEYMPYAVACGNTYIVKPCSDVPISQVRIFELIDKAGFPPGVVNLVHGSREVVDRLLESPDTRGLSFVGSSPVGKLLYQKAGEHGKRAQIAGGAKNFLV